MERRYSSQTFLHRCNRQPDGAKLYLINGGRMIAFLIFSIMLEDETDIPGKEERPIGLRDGRHLIRYII